VGGSPIPSFSYPSNDYASKKGVLLGFYGTGNLPGLDGRPLLDSTVNAGIEHVLTHASKIHPQMREEFENAYAVWWPKVKYSEGAWGGNPGTRMEVFGKPDGRVYFGCAGASSDPAWQEGAVESAWRTYKSLHERVLQSA
jgi:monoamine oxidase